MVRGRGTLSPGHSGLGPPRAVFLGGLLPARASACFSITCFERRDRADVNEGQVQDAPESCRSRTARSVPARYPMPRQPRSARSSAHALPLRASRRAHRAPHDTRPLPSACSNLSCGTRCRCPLLARPLSTTVRHTRRPLRRPSRAQGTRGAQHAPPPLLPPLVKRRRLCTSAPPPPPAQNLKSGSVSIALMREAIRT